MDIVLRSKHRWGEYAVGTFCLNCGVGYRWYRMRCPRNGR